MIKEINHKDKIKFIYTFFFFFLFAIIIFLFSLIAGQYGLINPVELGKIFLTNFGLSYDVSETNKNVVELIRLPRTIAAFIIGGSLSIAGLVYQNTFNNKLVSPDILGVNSGACVGAGIAILLGLNNFLVSLLAFIFGMIAVIIAITLPKIFKNKNSIMLVLSGIIVGSFMNSVIGIIKYIADSEDKLSSITFWMMGSLSGIALKEIAYIIPFIFIPILILFLLRNNLDVIALGFEETRSLGLNYQSNRLAIILCSTMLTASCIAICGQVGWVGLVVPHITRALIGNQTKYGLPIAFIFGGCFMMIVDLLSRTLSKDNIPLSIITGIFGAVIYTIVLLRKGRQIHD